MKSTKAIRKELAILIHKMVIGCTTDAQKNKAVNDARAEINKKYGHDWRSRDAVNGSGGYDEWWQEKNMDGSFAYNGVTDDF